MRPDEKPPFWPELLGTIWFICREVAAWILFIIVIWALFSLNGCGSVYKLPHKYHPLEEVVEFDLPIIPDTAITTIGTTAYVASLGVFLDRDEGMRHSELLHEQCHSKRQKNHPLGVTGWLLQYLFDTEFARVEEEMGWGLELRYRIAQGYTLNRPNIVRALRNYRVLTGKLWGFEEAQRFVDGVR